MLKKIAFVLFLSPFVNLVYCQSVDSLHLHEVIISSYLTSRPLLRLPSSACFISKDEIRKSSEQSLVPVMNTAAGVRMEERSPGSYRLSIRGSLLRSPFGIRNVKIYMNEFPLTDAGGNTYLNLLDLNAIHSIEILKGPDGSLFGANSGGVVRLNMFAVDTTNEIRAGIGSGSYGLFHQHVSIQQRFGKNRMELHEGWQRSDGYRENSRFDRKFVQLTDQFQYNENGRLRFVLFYSELHYQTPGGLTFQQWVDAPEAARPGTTVIPGAKEQKAAIYNSTFYGGISNEIKLSSTWSNTTALFGSYTDFKNPFITNYEMRNEHTAGVRTWLQASNNREGNLFIKFHLGTEASQTGSNIKNYNNVLGQTGAPQKFDVVYTNQAVVFSHVMFDFYNKWLLEGGLSLNFNSYSFYTTFPYVVPKESRSFKPQFMPKVAVSYQLAARVAWRVSVAKGFSPPTLAEIRSSNNEINLVVQPEKGWNYETGIRLHTRNNSVWWDASVFYYQLNHAIVRRVNGSGQEYFINAGGTQQSGLESQLMLQLLSYRNNTFIRGIQFNNVFTFSDFKFSNYTVNSINYSGNKLTGVPSTCIVSGLTFKFPAQVYLFVQHQYTSSIFLDDANSVSVKAVHLFIIKGGWKMISKPHFVLELSGGVDNLLNAKYSLGNDLNAAGGRYFNAAMPRNYFCKLEMKL